MDSIINVLTALTPLVAILVGTGLVYKYLPWLAKLPNVLIPFLNALIAFVTAFTLVPGDSVPKAEAGIFGDIVGHIGLGARVVGSLAVSALASGIYEVYIRPTLDKLGVKKAT